MNRRRFIRNAAGIFVPTLFLPKLIAQPFSQSSAFRAAVNQQITQGLLGHWKCDEQSGTVVNDCSGRGKVGTAINAPTWLNTTSGKFCSGLSFTAGSSQAVSIGDIQQTGLTTASLSCWAKRNSSGDHWSVGDDLINKRFCIATDSTSVYFICENTSGYRVYVQNDTNWHHYVMTFDGSLAAASRIASFVDGVSVGSVGVNGPTSLGAIAGFEFGHGTNEGYSTGSITAVRMYSKTLSQAEISILSQNP